MSYGYSEKGDGWIAFSAIMLGFGGTLAVIDGIVALSKSSFYTTNAHYMFSDLRTWGWINIILGSITILAAFAVVAGAEWARWFGIVVAALAALGQFAWIQAYPLWSLMTWTLYILVIYGLAVYGGKDRTGTI